MGGEDGEGGDTPTAGPQAGLAGNVDADDAEVDAVDERPWPVPRPSQKSVSEGSLDVKSDIGELAAERCIQWVNRKLLEHVGFQGTFVLLSHMTPINRDSYAQGHHSWRWMCSQGSQWSTCQMLVAPSASISTNTPI
jgi:transcriptional activator SPT7